MFNPSFFLCGTYRLIFWLVTGIVDLVYVLDLCCSRCSLWLVHIRLRGWIQHQRSHDLARQLQRRSFILRHLWRQSRANYFDHHHRWPRLDIIQRDERCKWGVLVFDGLWTHWELPRRHFPFLQGVLNYIFVITLFILTNVASYHSTWWNTKESPRLNTSLLHKLALNLYLDMLPWPPPNIALRSSDLGYCIRRHLAKYRSEKQVTIHFYDRDPLDADQMISRPYQHPHIFITLEVTDALSFLLCSFLSRSVRAGSMSDAENQLQRIPMCKVLISMSGTRTGTYYIECYQVRKNVVLPLHGYLAYRKTGTLWNLFKDDLGTRLDVMVSDRSLLFNTSC